MSLPRETTRLPAGVRALLAQLEMLSHGTVAKIGHATGGEGTAVMPPGDARPPHVHLREAWLAAVTDERRAVVEGWMADALREHRGRDIDRSHVREETAEELAVRIVVEGRGLEAGEASVLFRCTPTMVRRARVAQGYDADRGRPTPETEARLAEEARARAEVLRLAGKGMSVRAVAMATGVARSTVHDWIKRTERT